MKHLGVSLNRPGNWQRGPERRLAGEALGLEWLDIDVEKRIVKVNKNMVRVDGQNFVQRTTKTAYGKRTVPLNAGRWKPFNT